MSSGWAVARLSRQTLDRVPAPVRRPSAVVPQVGIVHLGIGAFHRAHQAVFTKDAAAAIGSDEWGIAGVTHRSATVVRQLAPQDGLYSVLERGVGAAPARRRCSSRRRRRRGRPEEVTRRIADPAVRVVTLTVTEKGYRRAVDGSLDRDDELVRRDIAGAAPRTVVGHLVRGLQARLRTGGAPVTVVCCDNLTDNGAVLRGLVRDFCAALPSMRPTS